MDNIVIFEPKAELDASENLNGFIDVCRNALTIFGANLDFDENVWDITEHINLRGFGNKRQRLVFSNFQTSKENVPTPMSEPFISFAKAYFRYMQGLKPVNGVGPRLLALRVLEAALIEIKGNSNPIHSDIHVFNRASQMIVDNYSPAAAYRNGGQLEMISNFLCDSKLTTVSVRWNNFIKRPNDAVRIGKEFDERRMDKMPTQTALDALPEIFLRATEPVDVIVSSSAAILCSSPDRINELLYLAIDCEHVQTDSKSKKESYGLRWRGSKGADPMIKWVVPTMVTVVQEAIKKIRKVTDEARKIAKWYEDHPNEIYIVKEFENLRGQEWLSLDEIANLLGLHDRKSANTWCNQNKIPKTNLNKIAVRFSDIEQKIISMLPESFPILDKDTGLKYSEALFVVRRNELGSQRGTFNCMIESVNINQINTGLGGRVEHGIQSIFSRFEYFEPDGSNINISTHQFRHYLNTLAQSGGLSQLDIAKWSGRVDIKQNAAYDHVTPTEMIQKIRNSLGEENMFFGPLAELSKKTLIPRDEFCQLVIPTAHTTEFGYCIHDYTMSNCQIHMDCINCGELVCVKGDAEKERNIRIQLDESRHLMKLAEQATKEEYFGSDRWLEYHKKTVERLTELLAIIDNPNYPVGAVIQLKPPKDEVKEIKVQKRINKNSSD